MSGANSRTAKHEPGSVQKVVKVGLVGDGTVGKTTMLMTYTMQAFITDYVPTVFDNFSVIEDIEGVRVNVTLWDTAGQEDYVNVRKVCYSQTDLFIVCFSLVHPNSFQNIKSKWLPELRQHAPSTPWVLVGTKTDLIDDPAQISQNEITGDKPVLRDAAKKLAKEEGAELYLSCSGKDVDSINKMFRDSIKFIVARDVKKLNKNLKGWKKELKEEEKLEKKMEELRIKEEKKKQQEQQQQQQD